MSSNTSTNLYDSLDGQVALVTGATRGIGEVIAAELIELGATVYAGARDTSDITTSGQRAVQLDVTEISQIKAAIESITDEAGRLDVLVNNAGIAGPQSPLDDLSTEEIDTTLATNLRGPMLLAKATLPLLLEREGGRIVNLSSGMGALSDGMNGGNPPYRISKAGLNSLTVYLHGEYGEDGLIANAVSPGWVRTDLGGPTADRSVEEGAQTPVWLTRFRPGSQSGQFWRNKETIDW